MRQVTDDQAKFIINILENTPIQGNRKERKAFDAKMDDAIKALETEIKEK